MELYILDGFVLIGLLKVVSDDEFEFRSTIFLGLAIGILALGLDWMMLQWLGQDWHFLSAVLIGAITTVVLMYLWGLEVKRALFVAVFLMAFHVGLQLLLLKYPWLKLPRRRRRGLW